MGIVDASKTLFALDGTISTAERRENANLLAVLRQDNACLGTNANLVAGGVFASGLDGGGDSKGAEQRWREGNGMHCGVRIGRFCI